MLGIDLEGTLVVDEAKDVLGGLLDVVDVGEADNVTAHVLPQARPILLEPADGVGREPWGRGRDRDGGGLCVWVVWPKGYLEMDRGQMGQLVGVGVSVCGSIILLLNGRCWCYVGVCSDGGEVDDDCFGGVDGDVEGDGVGVIGVRVLDLGIDGCQGGELDGALVFGVVGIQEGHWPNRRGVLGVWRRGSLRAAALPAWKRSAAGTSRVVAAMASDGGSGDGMCGVCARDRRSMLQSRSRSRRSAAAAAEGYGFATSEFWMEEGSEAAGGQVSESEAIPRFNPVASPTAM